jgi:hypothetical protein
VTKAKKSAITTHQIPANAEVSPQKACDDEGEIVCVSLERIDN